MIHTVTMNPALDLFLCTDRLDPDVVARASAERRMAGGKGINVSRVLRALGVESRAIVFAGRETGDEVVRLAREEGILVESIPVSEPTRINIVVEDSAGRRFKVNAPGPPADGAAIETLAALLEREADGMRALVLCGALPPGVLPGIYAELVRFANERSIPTIVDTSGHDLAQVIPARPHLLKINARELQELFGTPLGSADDLCNAARELVNEGLGAVCITRGSEGALLATGLGVWQGAASVRSDVRAVGAGDAFLAGLLAAYLEKTEPGEMLRRAIACGTAWAVSHEAKLTPDTIAEIGRTVSVSRL